MKGYSSIKFKRRIHKSLFSTGFLPLVIHPFRFQFRYHFLVKQSIRYALSEKMFRTRSFSFMASRASMRAVISIRLLVVFFSAPNIFFEWRPYSKTAPHPPRFSSFWFPEHAPSVYMFTVFKKSPQEHYSRNYMGRTKS